MSDDLTGPTEAESTASLETSRGIGRRLRRAFGWSALGSYLFAAAQFGVLLVITATGPAVDVAAFLLALAVTTPLFMVLSMNLRAVLAAETGDGASLRTYIITRLLSSGLALALAILVAGFVGLGTEVGTAIVLMAVARSVEQMSNLAQGAYLFAERHKYVAVSQMGQAVLGYGAFSIAYIYFENLEGALLALGVGWLISAAFVDSRLMGLVAGPLRQLRGSESILQLVRRSFPLGLERGATVLASYLPLIALDLSSASVSVVAAFGVVTQTVRIVQVLARSTSFTLIPVLSKMYVARQFELFKSILLRAQVAALALGVASFAIAYSVGDALVEIVFGSAYVIRGLIEVATIAGIAVLFLALVAAALISAQRFSLILGIRAISIVITASVLLVAVPSWGAIGAASAAAIGNALAACVGLLALRASVRSDALAPSVRT